MKENKTMDAIQRDLIKKYHALCRELRMSDDERRTMLESNYQVESSRDLTQHQLVDVCAHLARELERRGGKESLDTLRKRLIAVIAKYLVVYGLESNISIIKATACRAAKVDNFNKISRSQLQALYGAFRLKVSAVQKVDGIYRDAARRKAKKYNK